MSIFDDLRIAYRASQEIYRDYARNSLAAAQELAHSFREYIGAPDSYLDPTAKRAGLMSISCHSRSPTASRLRRSRNRKTTS